MLRTQGAQGAEDPVAKMRQLVMGFRATQMLAVAAKLGLADELAKGPSRAAALAKTVGAAPEPLYRLMRGLASLGVLSEAADGTFALTPLGQLLQRDAPGSFRTTALLFGNETFWAAYGRMPDCVRTGDSAFVHEYGETLYEHLAKHEAPAAVFHEAMSGFSAQEIAAILAAHDFSEFATVVDVGGGQGALVAALLKTNPRQRGIVFDQDDVAGDAQRLLAQAGLSGRATFAAGDFFKAVPAGGDAYLLKSVIHNWQDEDATAILRSCRQAMTADARLILIERVIPAHDVPSEAKLFDVNMLVTAGGRERTEPEYRALLDTCGFELMRIVPTASPVSLIVAKPTA